MFPLPSNRNWDEEAVMTLLQGILDRQQQVTPTIRRQIIARIKEGNARQVAEKMIQYRIITRRYWDAIRERAGTRS